MRPLFSIACLALCLALAQPAEAQLRTDARTNPAPTRLYDAGGPAFSLNKLFSPEHFKMSHSYEMSMGSFGGNGYSLGMYTNSMQFQFNQKLAARVDVALAHQPFGGQAFGSREGAFGQQNARVFLRNAEVAYQPTENTRIHLQVRQSPYGSYMSPYGYYRPHGFGYDMYRNPDDLFFRNR